MSLERIAITSAASAKSKSMNETYRHGHTLGNGPKGLIRRMGMLLLGGIPFIAMLFSHCRVGIH